MFLKCVYILSLCQWPILPVTNKTSISNIWESCLQIIWSTNSAERCINCCLEITRVLTLACCNRLCDWMVKDLDLALVRIKYLGLGNFNHRIWVTLFVIDHYNCTFPLMVNCYKLMLASWIATALTLIPIKRACVQNLSILCGIREIRSSYCLESAVAWNQLSKGSYQSVEQCGFANIR